MAEFLMNGLNLSRYAGKDEKVTLPEQAVFISSKAFPFNKYLKTLIVPATTRHFDFETFVGCDSFIEFIVAEENEVFSAKEGILYNKAGDTILYCPNGKAITDGTIPDGVKGIGARAFYHCQHIDKIVIPGSIDSIEDEAFPYYSMKSTYDIIADPKAGSGGIGKDILGLNNDDQEPLFFPMLPPRFVKERKTQVRLAFAFCQKPEKYGGDYAELYKKYVKSGKKSILKKAEEWGVEGIAEYFEK